MPIIITFDVTDSDNNQRNRVQDFFTAFGWQNVGGSAYRYPPIAYEGPEDWWNHVIPALMLFRRYLLSSGRIAIRNLTLDANVSLGCDTDLSYGDHPRQLTDTDLHPMPYSKFTVDNILEWVNTNDYPYP